MVLASVPGPAAADAGWIWEPAVQMTFAVPDTQVIAKVLRPRAGGGFHQVIEAWSHADGRNNGFGLYMEIEEPTNWPFLWAAAHTFTRMPEDSAGLGYFPDGNSDLRMLVTGDEQDEEVHVFYEAKYYEPAVVPTTIAYKRRGDSTRWDGGDPWILSADGCFAASPRPFYEPQSDVLHLVFGTVDGCESGDGIQAYRKKPVSAPDSVWSPVVYITPGADLGGVIGGGLFAEPDGTVHLVGSREVALATSKEFFFTHRTGMPPAEGGEWTPSEQILDYYEKVNQTSTPPETSSGDAPTTVAQGDGWLYAAWERPMDDVNDGANEIFFAAYDLDSLVWTPEYCANPPDCNDLPWFGLQLTPTDDVPSEQPVVVVDEDGTVHVIYREDPSYLWHIYNDGDPTVLADWSEPTLLSFEAESTARLPSVVAEGDTLWVAYSVKTTPVCQPGACERQGFFKRGYSLPDSVGPAGHLTWRGRVNLTADFLVAEGETLSVDPGTEIIAAAVATGTNQGRWPDLVEIVVDGTLLVNGEPADPVLFTSSVQVAGSWGGILFRDTSDMSISSIRHAEIEYPVFGVQVDSLACTLFEPRFTGVGSAAIYVDHDTRIAEEQEWTLKAPTEILVAFGQSADILVDGVFSTFGESLWPGTGSVVVRAARTPPDTAVAGDWEGIEFRGSSTGQLYDLDIRDARNPLCFLGADFARVWHGKITNYREVGILDYVSESWIEDCDITAAVGQVTEQIGIRLIGSSARVVGNTIGAQRHFGLKVEFSSSQCYNPPSGLDTLRILDNMITGPTEASTWPAIGVQVSWGCEARHPRIRDNVIQDWPVIGLDLVECEDVAATCNVISNNNVGIRYNRLKKDGAPWVELASNEVEYSNDRNIVVDGAKGLILQAVSTGVGRNVLRRQSPNAFNLRMNALVLSGGLTAGDNNWVKSDSTVCTTSACADSTIDGPGAHLVNVGTVRTDQNTMCSGGALAAFPQPEEAPIGDGLEQESAGAAESVPLPDEFAVLVRRVAGGGTRIRYGLPTDVARVTGRIFDVRGRVVRTLPLGEFRAGWHDYVWAGESDDGHRVASGVYFVRVVADDATLTRKAVVLR